MAKKRQRTSTYEVGPVDGPMTRYRRYIAAQCRATHWGGQRQCQGVYRHEGPHWCYGPDGWLELWKQRKDIKGRFDWASQTIPPDHKRYVHPKDKAKERHSAFDRIEVVKRNVSKAEPKRPDAKKRCRGPSP